MSGKQIGKRGQIETSLLTPCVARVMRLVWDRAMKQTSYQVWLQVWQIREEHTVTYFVRERAEESDEQRPG